MYNYYCWTLNSGTKFTVSQLTIIISIVNLYKVDVTPKYQKISGDPELPRHLSGHHHLHDIVFTTLSQDSYISYILAASLFCNAFLILFSFSRESENNFYMHTGTIPVKKKQRFSL